MQKMYKGFTSIGKPRLDVGAALVSVVGACVAFVCLYAVCIILTFALFNIGSM